MWFFIRLNTNGLTISTLVLIIIVFISLFVRVIGINFGLPYIYHPDEVNKIMMAQGIFKTFDLNPHYFKKPTLFIYLNALAYAPYYLCGKLFGAFQAPVDISLPVWLVLGVAYTEMPSTVIMGRFVTAVFAAASIPFVFWVGRRVGKSASVGLLAALMLAISPTHVQHSRYITENSLLVFFICVAILASVRLLQQGKTIDYIIAGLAAGLAVSSKYPGVLIAVVPICAHFLRPNLKDWTKDFRLFLCVGLVPAAFFTTTPFALLDYGNFLRDAVFEVKHYATGHPGMEGDSLVWYLSHAWRTAGPFSICAVLEMVRGIYTRSREIILLSLFVLIYFPFISYFEVRNDRTFLPLEPFLFVLAASFLVHVFEQVQKIGPNPLKRCALLVGVSFLAACFVQLALKTAIETAKLTRTDSRETARIWVNDNLPAGARIAVESYSSFVDPSRFSIKGFEKIIEHGPQWYIDNGFDYIIFGQGMYGRFYREPAKYRNEIAQYDDLFKTFSLVNLFTDGGYEVRIYKVGSSHSKPSGVLHVLFTHLESTGVRPGFPPLGSAILEGFQSWGCSIGAVPNFVIRYVRSGS